MNCGYCSRSEGDRVSGGGADFGKVCGTLFNALSFQIGGDGVQDRQELGTVSGTVEQGEGEVAGHGRIVVCGLKGEADQRSAIISLISMPSIAGSFQRTPSRVSLLPHS